MNMSRRPSPIYDHRIIIKVCRNDQCGAIMKWDMYGDNSDICNCGWEIEHIKPDNKGGEDI